MDALGTYRLFTFSEQDDQKVGNAFRVVPTLWRSKKHSEKPARSIKLQLPEVAVVPPWLGREGDEDDDEESCERGWIREGRMGFPGKEVSGDCVPKQEPGNERIRRPSDVVAGSTL
uniref:Uncharacterized protein n=1 Tax=Candidatus Kentrum sp. FW TaxID=2126338 RepID=A0A450SHC5_9GAMM|nr:MAG: hypothetical protein BECKFW1821A_GA0114235_10373 [Candidatus Kentron sp. FW]